MLKKSENGSRAGARVKQRLLNRLARWLQRDSGMSTNALVERAQDRGYFIAKARAGHVYVPRKRLADEKATPLILEHQLPAFYETADKVISDGCTMMRYERLFTLWQALANTARLTGTMAEIGVWRGGSSYLIANGRKKLAGSEAPLIAIDTFAGHPPETIDAETDPFQRPKGFAWTSFTGVKNYLSAFPCEVIAGNVLEVLPTLPEHAYFLVHIDTDIYVSTAACLRYFHERLMRGGVIVVDDFGAKKCPGVAQAVHEYLPSMPDCQVWQMRTEQCLIVKVAAGSL